MIIESLYIKSFGKLDNVTINLSDGVNILRGENEAGKSTVCSFIRFVFYGLAGRGAEEKQRYISWNSSSASGYAIVSSGGRRYRIEREAICTGDSEGKLSIRERSAVIDTELSTAVFRGQNAGEVFFGVPADVFESTVYVGQIGDSRIGGRPLAEAAENILFSASESVNAKKAIKKLDDARVYLLYKNKRGGKIAELEAKKAELSERLEKARAESGDIIFLEGTQRELSEKTEKSKKRLAECSKELDTFEKYSTRQVYLTRKEEAAKLREMEQSAEKNRLCEKHGGVPVYSDDYITSLEELSRRLETTTARYDAACSALDEANRKIIDMSEKIEVFRRLGSRGDKRDRIVDNINAGNKMSKTLKTVAVIMAVLTFIFAAICIISLVKAYSYATIFAVLACVSIIASIALFVISKSKHKIMLRDCSTFGCRSYEEFDELVKAAGRDEAVLTLITETKDKAEVNAKKAADELDATNSKIVSVLTQASFTIETSTRLSLSEALKICRKEKSEYEKLKIMLESQRQKVRELDDKLRSCDESYLREALTGTYDEEKMKTFDAKSAKRNYDFLQNSIGAMTEKLAQTEKELAVLNATVQRPTEISETLLAVEHELDVLREKFDAYVMAIDAIEAAGGKLREGISPKIAKSASAIMSKLSCGKYSEIGIDPDFAMTFTDGASTHTADYFSAGTSDIAYISLRIALMEVLFTKSKPPLIFDESFARTDDARLPAALKLISEGLEGCSSQSLIFTCHGREERAMAALGNYNLIRL